MDTSSPAMTAIVEAVTQPDKVRSRVLLLELWERLSPAGDPVQICSMAHALADTESDAAAELEWDLRSLEGAAGSRAAADRDPLSADVAGLLPSIHLSVAEGYRNVGDLERARLHVRAGENRIGLLPDDAYGRLIRGGLRRLQGLLA
jgi:hypothetical protein